MILLSEMIFIAMSVSTAIKLFYLKENANMQICKTVFRKNNGLINSVVFGLILGNFWCGVPFNQEVGYQRY